MIEKINLFLDFYNKKDEFCIGTTNYCTMYTGAPLSFPEEKTRKEFNINQEDIAWDLFVNSLINNIDYKEMKRSSRQNARKGAFN